MVVVAGDTGLHWVKRSLGEGLDARIGQVIHVLVVDECAETVDCARSTLANERRVIHTTTDGAGAKRLMQTYPIDVVVCDLHRPDMGYDEILHASRLTQSQLPVIIHSIGGSVTNVLRAMGHAAFDYVLKGMDSVLTPIERASVYTIMLRENIALYQAVGPLHQP